MQNIVEQSPIFLIGYMGVGKTTIGKQLAKKIGFSFFDTDQWIEDKMQLSIPEVFRDHGESYFRDLEKKAIDQIPKEKIIIATGGGLPCFGNLMQTMNEIGLTVYLHRPVKELVQRLKNAKTNRPLISDKSEGELFNFISSQITQREKYYCQAHLTITREQQNVADMITAINSFQKS